MSRGFSRWLAFPPETAADTLFRRARKPENRVAQSNDACESSHEQKIPPSHETGNVPSVPGFQVGWFWRFWVK
jgi:hypothetical protein